MTDRREVGAADAGVEAVDDGRERSLDCGIAVREEGLDDRPLILPAQCGEQPPVGSRPAPQWNSAPPGSDRASAVTTAAQRSSKER
ncbi:hypothetical protein AB0F91_11765 [Amycolatopsis sp. NPDC023774]|uniref:hypothetical protein n=1 Tax=Amycolatopsis sp. NPDC023774 TaxID=3155015 RepID=UPI0033FB990A